MKLVKLTREYKDQYLEMLEGWGKIENYKEQSPFPLSFDVSDFGNFIGQIEKLENDPDDHFVPSSTYCLLNEEGKFVAMSNLRHYLNDRLKVMGGHIGYGTRADMRSRGYATKILELTLLEAKKRGIEEIFVTCYVANIASNKTIQKNGGILAGTINWEGRMTNQYWIKNLL
jgi:predicted acetyltransferase